MLAPPPPPPPRDEDAADGARPASAEERAAAGDEAAGEESIASEMVRPIPPPHLTNNFMPTVGEQVELQYQNGWWPVVVKKKERGDKWVVEYEEQITHTVKRDLLRPYLIYNSAGAQWLKGK